MKKNGYGQGNLWPVLIKTALVMKIWFLLLIPAGVALAGTAHSQNLSLELKDVTIRQALHAIERESGYSFFYNDSFRDLEKKISVTAKNEPISDVLGRVLSNTLLTHKFLEGKLIVIVLKDAPEKIRVHGQVTGV